MTPKSDNIQHSEDHDGSDEEKQAGIQSDLQLEGKDVLRTVDAGFSPDQVVAEVSEAEGRRVLRKVDYRLIPLLSFLYL